jgi:hypothetical protein
MAFFCRGPRGQRDAHASRDATGALAGGGGYESCSRLRNPQCPNAFLVSATISGGIL